MITLAAEAVLFGLYLMAVRKRLGPQAALYPVGRSAPQPGAV